jgi:hypothetical protein
LWRQTLPGKKIWSPWIVRHYACLELENHPVSFFIPRKIH